MAQVVCDAGSRTRTMAQSSELPSGPIVALLGKAVLLRAVALVVVAGAFALAGCGGGGKSGTPTASSSTQTLKRVDVHVTRGGTAEAPRSSMVAMIGNLLGWPQLAEASTGVSGCSVTGGGATATTDANGDAILTGVTFPTTVNVSCPGGQTGSFPVTGTAGAIVKVEVEVGSIEVKVKTQKVEKDDNDDQGDDNDQGDDSKTASTHHQGSGDD